MIPNGSINFISNGVTTYKASNVPVWMAVLERYPVSGVITLSTGDVIPAGSPVAISGIGGEVSVLTSSDSDSKVCVGFTENDVYSEAGGKASVDIVTKGTLCIDRCPDDAEAFIASLPGITVLREFPAPVKVSSVRLNKASTTLQEGATETLTTTVEPSNAANKGVTWSSNRTDIATVSNGKVTAVKQGTTTITVTTVDGNKTATCAVTVTPIAVTGVTLNKSETTIVKGQSETLTATVAPPNASNKSVTWKSDQTEIASVDDTGKVTAVAAGSTIITVTTVDGSKTATCNVTVTDA